MTTSWLETPWAIFDFETTGIDPLKARPVTAATAMVQYDQEMAEKCWAGTRWLVNPGIDIHPKATEIHGITNEVAKAQGLKAADAIDEITRTLLDMVTKHAPEDGDSTAPVVGMNLAYDMTIMAHDAKRHGVQSLFSRAHKLGLFVPIIDTYVLDKYTDPYRKTKDSGGRKLGALCKTYGVDHGGEHDALEDALASARIAVRIGTKSRLRTLALRQLHAGQVKWRAEQCANLERFFRSQKKENPEVDPCWPVCWGHQERNAQSEEPGALC